MDCSEFLLRSVVCGASVAATREGRGAAWRVRDTVQVIRSDVYLLLKFWVFKDIKGRENR